MAYLNKLRRVCLFNSQTTAAIYRKSGNLAAARKAIGWSRFDRECLARGGWRMP